MATPHMVPLRILITINNSEYYLAKPKPPVIVTPIPAPNPGDTPIYGTVSLKTCIQHVAIASPELTCDPTRDYTVYLMDPLESQVVPSLSIGASGGASTSSTSQAMAVAQGSMIRALNATDAHDVQVNGTFMKKGTEPEALEVILAFRDAKPQAVPLPPTSTASSSSSNPPLHRSASQPVVSTSVPSRTSSTTRDTAPCRTKSKPKLQKPPRPSATPVTESDKLLNAETYIGPLKKKGRPKANADSRSTSMAPFASSSNQEVIVIDGSDDTNPQTRPSTSRSTYAVQENKKPSKPPPAPLSSTTALSLSGSQSHPPPPPPPAAQKPTSQSPEDNQTAVNALATLFSDPQAVHVLRFLSQLDSGGSGQALDPTMIARLLQAATSHPQPSATPQTDAAAASTVQPIDKENIRPVPALHRKSSEKDLGETKVSERRSSQGLVSSSRANEAASSKSLLKDSVNGGAGARKRTLSDFMDERENRVKGKGKDRERGEPRETQRHETHNHTSIPRTTADGLRHYRFDQPRSGGPGSSYYRTGAEPWTSPSRPPPPMAGTTNAPPVARTFLKPPSPRVAPSLKLSQSSPARPPSFDRANFRVPGWAVTTTATKPRLSEQALRAREEAEEKRNEARKAARRNKAAAKKSKPEPSSEGPSAPPPPLPTQHARPRPPVAASSSRPVFAAANIVFPSFGSSRPSSPLQSSSPIRPSSPTPSRPSIPQTPKTPVRRRVSSNLTTPKPGAGSLFTPTPGGGSLFGSGHSSRSPGGLPILTSPLGNRKKARTSSEYLPARLRTSPRTPLTFPGSSSTASAKSTAAEDSEEELTTQLDNAFEEMGSPPSSLPVASSDTGEEPQAAVGDEIETDTDVDSPVKQHWAGLPPSSPPPPSSPQLQPQAFSADEEMDEVPIATSDSDADADTDMDTTQEDGAIDPLAYSTGATPRQLSQQSTAEQFCMDPADAQAFAQFMSDIPGSEAMFEQFTDLNGGEPGSSAHDLSQWGFDPNLGFFDPAALGMGLAPGGADMTLEGFWETIKPLIDEGNKSDSQEGDVCGVAPSSALVPPSDSASDAAPSPSTSSTDPSSASTPSVDFAALALIPVNEQLNMGDFDVNKFTGELQSLFSGYLV